MSEDRVCGTCKWWKPKRGKPWGECSCPIPASVIDHVRSGMSQVFDATVCPCYSKCEDYLPEGKEKSK